MSKETNIEIREALKKDGVYQWELAKELGISEATLVKRMRAEFDPIEKELLIERIHKISGKYFRK